MKKADQAGYSLAELLVVVAIIGIISLVTVPNFIGLMKASKMKSSLRALSSDIRTARQRAISQYKKVKITFATGAAGTRTYGMYDYGGLDASGNTIWTQVGTDKKLEENVYFYDSTFTDKDVPADSKPDLIFTTTGGLEPISPAPTEYSITLRTDANIAQSQYKLTFGFGGNFTSVGSKWN